LRVTPAVGRSLAKHIKTEGQYESK
jgi:hypothetical protein